MPQGDRTGPTGQGPGTGRALGFCSGYDTPGYTKGSDVSKGGGAGFGMGRGMGFGRGLGYGRSMGFGRGMGFGKGMGFGRSRHPGWPGPWFGQSFPGSQPITSQEEIKMLKLQAESLEKTRKAIEKRLIELEKDNNQ